MIFIKSQEKQKNFISLFILYSKHDKKPNTSLFIYAIITKQQYQNEGHIIQRYRKRDLRNLLCALRNLSV